MDITIASNNPSQATDDCTVCLNSLTSGSPILTLSCNHKFHFKCITLNIQANNHECPLCRAAIDDSVIQQLSHFISPLIQNQQMVQSQVRQASTNDGGASDTSTVSNKPRYYLYSLFSLIFIME